MAYNPPMLVAQHTAITRRALEPHFNRAALEAILRANARQDSLSGLVGHPEYHFDDDAFDAGRAYMDEQRRRIFESLLRGDAASARAAFGRLLHTAQDFYAHTDYVTRWLSRFDGGTLPPPPEIDPVAPGLLASPDLRSGKVAYLAEVLVLVPGLRRYCLQSSCACFQVCNHAA